MKYLTKSRFKTGSECPRKLFYLDRDEYPSNRSDDSFLKALAEGGFQVGALAKAYYPEGIEIKEKDPDRAAAKTKELLQANENITLFEAAIVVPPFAARIDVLKKRGNQFELIEVKAKSWDPDESFATKGSKNKPSGITAKWKPYLIDIAFQSWLFSKAYPKSEVVPFLGLMDKSKFATVDGLHQLFLVKRDGTVVTPNLSKVDLGEQILATVNVSKEVELVLGKTYADSKNFEEYVKWLASIYHTRDAITPEPTKSCKECEFRNDKRKLIKRDGFLECWESITGSSQAELEHRPLTFNLWYYMDWENDAAHSRYFLDEIHESKFEEAEDDDPTPGLSRKARQLLQLQKTKSKDNTPYIDREELGRIFSSFKYPLHFIDFETTRVAIPFHKEMRTYEQIAFQFSEHVVEENGIVRHASQYINKTPGKFPNFEFVRELKHRLEGDSGSVFMYYPHEERVLREIRAQLLRSYEPDKKDLVAFIESLTNPSSKEKTPWRDAPRALVDMWDMVVKYYFHPLTGGSNSIKKVLPSILHESKFLQEKYSKPIYGAIGGVQSLNYENMLWVSRDSQGSIIDPYAILKEPIFEDVDLTGVESLFEDQEIAEGGAAMIAYSRMQFTQMSEKEREVTIKKLLRYCELDTLAMVMIYEYWQEQLL